MVVIRQLDYETFADILIKIQKAGGFSVGNEHDAVMKYITDQTIIPNKIEALLAILQPELPSAMQKLPRPE